MKNIIRKKVKTSYTVSNQAFEKLKYASTILGISREKLAKRVLYKTMCSIRKMEIVGDNVVTYNRSAKVFKKQYFRWEAKEYVFLQQCRMNMRYSISYLLSNGIEKYLNVIVMAILRKRKKKQSINQNNFEKLLIKFNNFHIYWPHLINKTNKPQKIKWKFDIL